MRHQPIPVELPKANRQRLIAELAPRSLAVVNANDVPPTNSDGTSANFPNSDLFYLTGIEQEQSVLLLAPDASDEKMREILFIRERTEHLVMWDGHKLTKAEASAASGIDRVEWLHDFPSLFRQLMCELDHAYLNSNDHPRAVVDVESRDARFIRETQQKFPLIQYRPLARLLRRLRLVKSSEEVAILQHAADITQRAFENVSRLIQPGMNECEVEAEFSREFIRQRGRFAFLPIIAAGKNGCSLHYTSNDQPCNDGDLLLLDLAASYANYNADVTRTLPVNGKFTPRQRQVYEAVLRVLKQSTAALKPGKLPRDWQKEAEAHMETELLSLGLISKRDIKKQDPEHPALKQYFMHGLGHPLGLDVHDVNVPGMPMAAGWVMTVEPGIYIPEENLAVRLEDDVLITESGTLNLTGGIPVEPDDVEAMMAGRKTKRKPG